MRPLGVGVAGGQPDAVSGKTQQPVMMRTDYGKKRPRWGFCQRGQHEHVYGNSAFYGARSL